MSELGKHLEKLEAEQKPITQAEARIIELLESIDSKLPDEEEARRRHFEMRDALGNLQRSIEESAEAMGALQRQLRERR